MKLFEYLKDKFDAFENFTLTGLRAPNPTQYEVQFWFPQEAGKFPRI